jgi:CheY-like chemotaxis protein/HPt (histidine-containing phosphotransfer) domain-containing protein
MSRRPTSTRDRLAELVKRVGELEHEAATTQADLLALRQQSQKNAHDFKDVLQAILSKAELLSESVSDPSRILALSEEILASAAKGVQLARASEAAEVAVAAEPPATERSARILLAEDQQQIREFIGETLTKAGHEVAAVANGAEAVAAARDTDFDLILMDLQMPVMDGLTAAQQIRRLPGARSTVPIVAISGNVQQQHLPVMVAAGVNDRIAKPFTKVALLQKVNAWLNRSEVARGGAPSLSEVASGSALDEVTELMGRAWVARGLTKLTEQIDEVFGVEPDVAREDPQLATRAHALVSLAALLGFAELSQLCSMLEDVCRSGGDVKPIFLRAQGAALQAHRDATTRLLDPD